MYSFARRLAISYRKLDYFILDKSNWENVTPCVMLTYIYLPATFLIDASSELQMKIGQIQPLSLQHSDIQRQMSFMPTSLLQPKQFELF